MIVKCLNTFGHVVSTKPRFIISCTVPEYSGSTLHHSSSHLALCVVILGLCAAPLGHGNWFHEAPDTQFLYWRCFQRQSEPLWWVMQQKYKWFFCSLDGPSVCVCVVYHFVAELLLLLDTSLIASTVSRGRSSRADISYTDLWQTGCLMTVPHLKSMNCWCLCMDSACLCAWFYAPFCNGCGWNTLNPINWRGVSILLAAFSD